MYHVRHISAVFSATFNFPLFYVMKIPIRSVMGGSKTSAYMFSRKNSSAFQPRGGFTPFFGNCLYIF